MSAAQRQREVSDPTATIRRRLAHLLALGAVRAARAAEAESDVHDNNATNQGESHESR